MSGDGPVREPGADADPGRHPCGGIERVAQHEADAGGRPTAVNRGRLVAEGLDVTPRVPDAEVAVQREREVTREAEPSLHAEVDLVPEDVAHRDPHLGIAGEEQSAEAERQVEGRDWRPALRVRPRGLLRASRTVRLRRGRIPLGRRRRRVGGRRRVPPGLRRLAVGRRLGRVRGRRRRGLGRVRRRRERRGRRRRGRRLRRASVRDRAVRVLDADDLPAWQAPVRPVRELDGDPLRALLDDGADDAAAVGGEHGVVLRRSREHHGGDDGEHVNPPVESRATR